MALWKRALLNFRLTKYINYFTLFTSWQISVEYHSSEWLKIKE